MLEQIDLDHTYYAINVASDGSELYVGGTTSDIAVHDTETFEQSGGSRCRAAPTRRSPASARSSAENKGSKRAQPSGWLLRTTGLRSPSSS